MKIVNLNIEVNMNIKAFIYDLFYKILYNVQFYKNQKTLKHAQTLALLKAFYRCNV